MTDLSVTAANVKPTGSTVIDYGHKAGASLTQGQPVYLDTATSTNKASDANGSGAKDVDGITLNAASSGQPIAVATGGDINPGASLTPGTVYCVSATAGGIAPLDDITTGDDVIIIGVATAANNLRISKQVTGVTL
jgi:hypothetical protein